MWKRLRIWTGREDSGRTTGKDGSGRGRSEAMENRSAPESLDEVIPRWPPFPRGLPAVGVERLLGTQREWIGKLRREAGVGDSVWEEHYDPLIAHYAAHVHLIPASQGHHHHGAGGLLRHGLEAAFYALRAGGERVVGLELPPSERKGYAERFRFCVFSAGLLHDVAKPVTDVVVTSVGGNTWNPLESDLAGWTRIREVTRYFVRWRDGRVGRHEAVGGLLLLRMLGERTSAWVNAGGPEWLMDLAEAISDRGGAGNLLSELAGEGDRASVAQDIAHRPTEVEPVELPITRWVLDAMRRMVRDGRWRIGGGIAVPVDGSMALAWPRAGDDIAKELRASGVVGVPYDPDSLADVLLDHGIAEPAWEAGGRRTRYWTLERRMGDGSGVRLKVLRIARVESLVDPPPPPEPGQFVDSRARESSTERAGAQSMSGADAITSAAGGTRVPGGNTAPGDGLPAPRDASGGPAPGGPQAKGGPQAVSGARGGTQGKVTEAGQSGATARPAAPVRPAAPEHFAAPQGPGPAGHRGSDDEGLGAGESEEGNAPAAAQQIFEAFCQDIRTGERHPKWVVREGGRAYIDYPEGIHAYGYSALDAAKLLAESGIIERPDVNRLVAKLGAGRGVCLSEAAQAALRIGPQDLESALREWFRRISVPERVTRGGRDYLPLDLFRRWLAAVAPGVEAEEMVRREWVVSGEIGKAAYVRVAKEDGDGR
ncbi:MAG: hypothetical protein B7Z66_14475 [Chromatiales bacterium 21-64-14]|nr:MAG: hypothetical protein B7Z66_14475 [Chromatiales bacterium 21-64-14]